MDTSATTKDRILDAAEKLFADRGFESTSLRDITTAAGANLASVNYYFQSKEALVQAVFDRRLTPINEARVAMLDELEARCGGNPVAIEDIFRAFVEPVLVSRRQGICNIGRLIGRVYLSPDNLFETIFRKQFTVVKTRFVAALARACPEMPVEELLWRLHFAIGSIAHALVGMRHIQMTSNGICDTTNTPAMLDRLITFLAAGFRAPLRNNQGDSACDGN